MTPRNSTPLVESAVDLLQRRLPSGWTVQAVADVGPDGPTSHDRLELRTASGMGIGDVLVEARSTFAAADVERLLGGLTRRLRQTSSPRAILLISEFLSPQTRRLLAEEDISYLDLTGNVRLVMDIPPLFVETSGAGRRTGSRGSPRTVGLKGAKAGSVVRFLAEVAPPYGVKGIEAATGTSRGYVSRILERLADEALIERRPRGPVERVDWPTILRERGRAVDLFTANTTRTYIAPGGARAFYDTLKTSQIADDLIVTGSFAAVRIAPIAAPALLVAYLRPLGRPPDFDPVARRLGLLEADEGPDVVLLLPANEDAVQRPRRGEGRLAEVNLPQLVVDCLGGSGRMPSEGEAVIDWMVANEQEWRYPSLDAFRKRNRP